MTWSRSYVTETRHRVSYSCRHDRFELDWHPLASTAGLTPAAALDDAFDRIGAGYGTRTAEFVAMQLESPAKKN